MKILITGGCGFLGSNLASDIIKNKKDDLFILDSLHRTGSHKNLKWLKKQGNFVFFKKDIRSKSDIDRVLRSVKPDIIFHLAGQVAMTTSIEDPRFDFEVNAMGSFNLLEGVKKYCKDSIVIYSSTNKVYGNLEYIDYKEAESRYVMDRFPEGFSEDITLEFHSPYGCSKGAADQYMLDFHRLYGLKTVVFRHSSMYGSRQFSTIDQGWIGWFCKKAIETKNNILKEPFTISGDGKQVRDVLYVDDMIDLYFNTIKNIDKAQGNAFNIGGGMSNSLSLLELFSMLEDALRIKLSYTKLPWRFSDQKIFVADIKKVKDMCGWSPKVNKHEGISKMIEWFREIG